MFNNVTVDFEVSGGSIAKVYEEICDHLTSKEMKIPDDRIVRVNKRWQVDHVQISECVQRTYGGDVLLRTFEASVRVRMMKS